MTSDQDRAMNESEPPRPPADENAQAPGQARHGYRNEVNWNDGQGSQPYGNQGTEESPAPGAGAEEPEGNRGERSGRSLEQLERVKTRP